MANFFSKSLPTCFLWHFRISLELGTGVSLLRVPYPCVTLDTTSLKSPPNKTLPGTYMTIVSRKVIAVFWRLHLMYEAHH
jgi:hypothetical protein